MNMPPLVTRRTAAQKEKQVTRISRHCAPYWYPKGAAAVTRTIPRECAFISTNLARPRPFSSPRYTQKADKTCRIRSPEEKATNVSISSLSSGKNLHGGGGISHPPFTQPPLLPTIETFALLVTLLSRPDLVTSRKAAMKLFQLNCSLHTNCHWQEVACILCCLHSSTVAKWSFLDSSRFFLPGGIVSRKSC